MDVGGVVLLRADRLSAAVERVERLGCLVTAARPTNDGEFACRVRMGLAAANAVAYAVIRRELRFQATQNND